MTISELLDLIAAEENTKAQEVFEALVAEKISEIVEELKPYVAEALLSGELSIDEDMRSLDKEIAAKKASGKWRPYNKLSMRKNIEADKERKKKKTNEEVELDEEQIDELSKKTLGSYVKKSADNMARQERSYATARTGAKLKDAARKSDNRTKGIERAVNKLTKEEVELDEKADAAKAIADFKAGSNPSWRKGGGAKGFVKRKIAAKLAAKKDK